MKLEVRKPTRKNTSHITDPELRDILVDGVDGSKEKLDYLAKETLAADKADRESGMYGLLHYSSTMARDEAVKTINENWGDGEDGDAKVFKAAVMFWMS